jgi:hypothetical protein
MNAPRAPIPEADLRPQRLTSYQARLHPAWSELDLPAFNLSRDASDLLGSDLLHDHERKFLGWLDKATFKPRKPLPEAKAEAWRAVEARVSALHLRRVVHLCERWLEPLRAAAFHREHAAIPA